MTNLKRRLKETFKPRKRRAISGVIIVIMVVVIGLAAVGLMSGTIFDLIDTTSVVDSLEITSPVVYADQEYVSVQVKNNGNTGVENVYAALLVNTVTVATPNVLDCSTGSAPALIGAVSHADLAPGESVTISGSLHVFVAPTTNVAVTSTAHDCDTDFENRGEYILQVAGWADDTISISKTISVRAR